MKNEESTGHVVNSDALPERFPTHLIEPAFWESLGRAVATFGFLEDVLSKAIFAFTATTNYKDEELEQAYKKWIPLLEKALADPLGNLIGSYGEAVRSHREAQIENFEELLKDLRKASKLRNVICHGSWGAPDYNGATVPFFVNREQEVFDTPIDIAFIDKLQKGTTDLICVVINTVTHMGWQFPGSSGPGRVIWARRK